MFKSIFAAGFILVFATIPFLPIVPNQVTRQQAGLAGNNGLPSGTIYAGNPIHQTFFPEDPILYGVILNFTYWDRLPPDATVEVSIASYNEKSPNKIGGTLASRNIGVKRFYQNLDYMVWFGKLKVDTEKKYVLMIESDQAAAMPLTLWRSKDDVLKDSELFINKEQLSSDLVFKTVNLKSLYQIFSATRATQRQTLKAAKLEWGKTKWVKSGSPLSLAYSSIPVLLSALVLFMAWLIWRIWE